jgi:hypothetical protein
MNVTKKPSRRDLLKVITELQSSIGEAMHLHANDRDLNGYEKAQVILEAAHELCIEARSFDKPTDC